MAYQILGILVGLGGVLAFFGAHSAFQEMVGGSLLTAGAVLFVGGAIVVEARKSAKALERLLTLTAQAAEYRAKMDAIQAGGPPIR